MYPYLLLTVLMSLQPGNRAGAATWGRGCCELPASLRVNPEMTGDCEIEETLLPLLKVLLWIDLHMQCHTMLQDTFSLKQHLLSSLCA